MSDIPDYENDITKLMNTEEIDFSKAIGDMLDRLFTVRLSEPVLDIIYFILWVALICFVLWILYKEFGSIYVPETTVADSATPDFSASDMGAAEDADIRGHNFDKELRQALADGDYPLAIHLRYLLTLQSLHNMRKIEWAPHKTPMMYVMETTADSEKLKEVTMAFLYVKYGHYPADRVLYDEVTYTYNELFGLKEGGEE